MGDLINLIALMKAMPTEFTVAVSTFVAILVIWLKSRDIDITAATSISKLQMDHIASLIAQNKALSEDLNHLRIKMSETYELMEEMRTQINDLEDMVRNYKRKCDTCQDRISAMNRLDNV